MVEPGGSDPLPDLPGAPVLEASGPSDVGEAIPDYIRTLIQPGSKVYKHPQGSWIVVDPYGGVVKLGPDGKPRKTSADAAKLAAGHGKWEPVAFEKAHATPKPKDVPVATKPMTDLEPAKAVVVSAKKDPELPSTPAPAGSKFSVPMAFDQAPVAEVPKFIADPNYVFQQKVDGIRGQLVVEPGKAPWFRSRSGQQLQNASATKITSSILASLGDMPTEGPSYTVDGELLNGRWYVFDTIVDGSEKMPYSDRLAITEQWVNEMHKAGLKQIQALPTARTPEEKQALWEAMNAQGGEGVMMKRVDAPYNPGARVKHSLKAKITSTADVVVMERNTGGHDNAVIGLRIGGKLTPIGTVSMQGKEKDGPVNVGDVIEVEYLWAMPGTNSIQQPRMVGRRPDKKPEDVDDGQLRFVSKDVLDKEGWEPSKTNAPESLSDKGAGGLVPTPSPEATKTPVSPAKEAISSEPAPKQDPVAAAIADLERSGKLHASGDPRSPEGMTITNDYYPDKPTTIHRTDMGWTATSDGKDRPLASAYPGLYRALTAGEPKSWEGLDPDKVDTNSNGWNDFTRADATVDMDMPPRPYPPYSYGGKYPPAKEMNPYYKAVSAWNTEMRSRLAAGGPPKVEVRIADPALASDAEIDGELGRLAKLSVAAHDAAAAVQDAGMNKALNSWDHYSSYMSDLEVGRIARAAEPLRAEMLRRLRERFAPAAEPGFDRTRWDGKNGPTTVRIPGGPSDDELQKIRDTYVVKDKNTIDKNASLRSAHPSAAAKTWRGKTDKWIRAHQTIADGRTWRGIAVPPSVLEQFKPGATIKDVGVVSTDNDESNAAFYLGERIKQRPDAVPVMLEILLPKGTHAVDAMYGEIVLPSSTPMVVREVSVDDTGTYRVTVEAGGQPGGAVTADGYGGRARDYASALRTRVRGPSLTSAI